jgi:hypothetical protein
VTEMKHASRQPSKLSESLNRQLNCYALAATAAGVSLLALGQPCAARIIHKQIGFSLEGIQQYRFNPANQAHAPFLFSGSFMNRTSAWWNRDWFVATASDAGVMLAKNGFVADVRYGAVIGAGKVFGKGHSSGLLFTYGPYGGGTMNHHRGNLPLEKTDYVGFKFAIAGKVHFGWIRMKISVHTFQGQEKITIDYLRDYAYETVPGKAIIAGKTHGPDQVAEGATLGRLALGRR